MGIGSGLKYKGVFSVLSKLNQFTAFCFNKRQKESNENHLKLAKRGGTTVKTY